MDAKKTVYIHTAPTGRYYADDDAHGAMTEDGPGFSTVGAALRHVAAQGYTHHRVSTWQRDGSRAIPKRYR